MRSGMWSDTEIEFIKRKRYEMSHEEIGKEIGRSRAAVSNKLKKLGLRLQEKYFFNPSYFENIDTEEKAYWLGFIYADGCVSSKYRLTIRLKESDSSHLRKFNKAIGGNIAIRIGKDYSKVTGKEYRNCSITVCSKKITEDLIAWGVVRKKSLSIQFPNIKSDLIRHFIRGYFDGDGSLFVAKKRNHLCCTLTCGSVSFTNSIASMLKELNINHYVLNNLPKSKAYTLGISGKDSTKRFLEFIYDDAKTYLDRKHETYCKNKNLLAYIYDGWVRK